MIRVMVVDNEKLARENLTRLISLHDDFKVVETAVDGVDALEKIKNNPVDVIFLDIEMPEKNGIEVASELIKNYPNPPKVVFATAYNQYAVEAFEHNAIDYILKPYQKDRLEKALERVKQRHAMQSSTKEQLKNLETELAEKGVLKRLVGYKRGSKEKIVIHPDQIYYFHTRLRDVVVYTQDQELIVNENLKSLNEKLDPEQFVQTHRAYLVNVSKIEKVAPLFNRSFEIFMNQGKYKVPLSRRLAKNIKKELNW